MMDIKEFNDLPIVADPYALHAYIKTTVALKILNHEFNEVELDILREYLNSPETKQYEDMVEVLVPELG